MKPIHAFSSLQRPDRHFSSLSLLLRLSIYALSLLLLLIPLTALSGCARDNTSPTSFTFLKRTVTASEVFTDGDYEYQNLDDGTVTLYAYKGSASNVEVPATLGGKPVSTIDSYAFSENKSLCSVTLGDNITEIGEFAFYGCSALENISFGKQVNRVGFGILNETPWLAAQTDEFLVIGDGLLLKYQGDALNVTLPSGIRHIGPAFAEQADLRTVTLTDEVLTVGQYAFYYCENLLSVRLGKNLVAIDDYAFNSCMSLTDILFPDSLTYIGDYAFGYCISLTSLHIGKSVGSVGAYAFTNCRSVTHVFLPASLKTISTYAFDNCYAILFVFSAGSEEDFRAYGLDGTNCYLNDAEKFFGYPDPQS